LFGQYKSRQRSEKSFPISVEFSVFTVVFSVKVWEYRFCRTRDEAEDEKKERDGVLSI
jgi:hypothetical protein